MPELLQNPALIILTVLILITTFLYFREYYLRKKLLRQSHDEYEIAKHEATQLIAAAQVAQTQILGEKSYVLKKIEDDFKQEITQLIESSEKSVSSSSEQLAQFIKDLQTKTVEFEQTSRQTIQQHINQMFGNLEQRLTDFLTSTEQKTTQSIELEVSAARNLIETYRQQQLKLIDENIIAMMEQTLNIVLAKKLSLKDQLDLVYEALEKAKIDKFII